MTVRMTVGRPTPAPCVAPAVRARDAMKGMLCGMACGAVGFFLVTCVFYASGRLGWRNLRSGPATGLVLGGAAGILIGSVRLRPPVAGLLVAGLSGLLCIMQALSFYAQSDPDLFWTDSLFSLALYLVRGFAAGALTAVALKHWSN